MATQTVNENDRQLLDMLRQHGQLTVAELTERIGVTANAVRQKLSRLVAGGLVQRFGEHGAGRGRPVHRYSLTGKGQRAAGNNLEDLARVLWQEIQAIPDESVRRQLTQSVTQRLADQYRQGVQGSSLEERLVSIAHIFSERDIPFETRREQGKPTLQIVGCPYPELGDGSEAICDLERELFSALADQRLQLSRHTECGTCRCKFEAAPDSASGRQAADGATASEH